MPCQLLICFDLHGTLTDDTASIWSTLHSFFGSDTASRRRAREQFFSGQITYKQWFDGDVVLLKAVGINKTRALQAISDIRLLDGALETIHALRDAGHRVCIISGGINLVVSHLFGATPPFDAVEINEFHFCDDGHLAAWRATPYDLDGKADGLRHLAARFAIPKEATVFVGDNFNDISAADSAGFAIAINSKSAELSTVADVVIKSGDFGRVLAEIELHLANLNAAST